MPMKIFNPAEKVDWAFLSPEGKLEVLRTLPSMMSYGNGAPVPDTVTLETYIAGPDGMIILESRKQGLRIPKVISEHIEWSTS